MVDDSRLRQLLDEHVSVPLPATLVLREDYGEVDAVIIDADICGGAIQDVLGQLRTRWRLRQIRMSMGHPGVATG